MRVKIFTIHHFVPDQWIIGDLFAPFVTGRSAGSHADIMSDNNGINIAQEQSYAEMRAHYYIWKNRLAGYDYVGFQHYRRLFFFDQMAAAAQDPLCTAIRNHFLREPHVFIDLTPEMFHHYQTILRQCGAADIELIKDFIGRHDIITVRPICGPLGEQYAAFHLAGDWDALVRLLPQHSRFRSKPQFMSPDLKLLYTCNMFIMRASEFDEYMNFWHELITGFAREVKPHDDPYQRRVYGFMSERIFSLYVHQRRMEQPLLRFAEMPGIMCQALRTSAAG